MLYEPQKVAIPSKTNSKELELELNWNKKVKPTDVKVTVGKEELVIDLKDLFYFVFTAGTADMQADLMPVRQTKVYKQIKQHRILINRDIKKGEYIVANCETDIPVSVVDTLRGELFKNKKGLGHGKVGKTFADPTHPLIGK